MTKRAPSRRMKRASRRTDILVVVAAFALCIVSCQSRKKGTFTVTGTFRNADKLSAIAGPISKVYLEEVSYGKDQSPLILDSARLPVSSGNFTLTGAVKTQEILEVVFGNNVIAVPLINDAPEVRVNVDLGKQDDFYTVSGSEACGQLKELITMFGKKNYDVDRTMADLDSLKQANAPDSLLLAATGAKNNAIQELNVYLKQVVNTNTNATICALALSWASRSFPRSDFEASLSDLVKKYPENATLAALKQGYDQQKEQMAQQQERDRENSWVGKQAPDFSLPDATGRNVSLASFKGKYLLVDFWASWCGPCRAENPNVVHVYNEFKDKNFAILGVSLDKDKDAWQEAIHADKLNWTQVSDLKYWDSQAVKTFNFEGIPFNVLIDPQGKIIAQGLRGEDLEDKLKEVLTN
ncbi:MAG TPA: TlpA disulfide reductase family protein [Puia sp.]|nr:TlpA disulfide reductase family protein [Puia sp.]